MLLKYIYDSTYSPMFYSVLSEAELWIVNSLAITDSNMAICQLQPFTQSVSTYLYGAAYTLEHDSYVTPKCIYQQSITTFAYIEL
jgi:hypothetical protein